MFSIAMGDDFHLQWNHAIRYAQRLPGESHDGRGGGPTGHIEEELWLGLGSEGKTHQWDLETIHEPRTATWQNRCGRCP